MKALNATTVQIGATEDDKDKLANLKTKMSLTKKLLRAFVCKDGSGFTLDPMNLELYTYVLKKKNSKSENRNVLWKSIAKCSRYEDQWINLFQ